MIDNAQAFPTNPPIARQLISFDRSQKFARLFQERMNTWQEEAWLVSLNSQLQQIQLHLLFRGTANLCPIHPRDVFRHLIMDNASSFVFAHNHPSGSLKPSREDLRITERLHKAGRLMEMPLVDHLIITSENYYSFADAGRIKR